MIDREYYYKNIRPFMGHLSVSQVQGMEAIFDEWDKRELADLRWLAYMLATAYHETAKTFQAIEEFKHGRAYPYGQKIKRSGVSYSLPDYYYYGRGLVQLTWFENYELMGRLLGIDLLSHPELALQLDVAIQIMYEGMLRGSSSFGDFTGKCLEMYFNDTTDNPVRARRIINGKDKARLIAGYHDKFLKALK